MPLSTPVLLIAFNRPDVTEKVFNAIRSNKPTRLFIAVDGPRATKPDDTKHCARVHEIVSRVDWDCDAKFLFRNEILGCKLGVSLAIDWFFENVEEGIILEDDCLPAPSFFTFCTELLQKYRNDNRVMTISGRNPLGHTDILNSYLFSRTFKEWGWASWRRAWQQRDIDKDYFDAATAEDLFGRVYDDPVMGRYLYETNKSVHYAGHDTWDYQWQFNIISQNGLVVVPSYNLIENIGLNSGTHFNLQNSNINRDVFGINTYALQFPLKHPQFVFPDLKYDKACFYALHPYLLPKKYTTLDRVKDSFKYRFNKLLGRA
jgi:hypothetical protein